MLRYFLSIILFFTTIIFANAKYPEISVGVVVPIEHQALHEIVSGFKDQLTKDYPGKINFIIKNSEGDVNLQRAIIQELKQDKEVKLIAPVATSTLQMTLAMVANKPVVGVAALYTDAQRQQNVNKNATNVDDEIGVGPQLIFAKMLIPNLRHITIIHSASDKIIPEVADFIKTAKSLNIDVQDLMVQQLSDLYTTSSRIGQNSQAIFMLKDNLIASGVSNLIKIATKNRIPLISSDDGTVREGAAFALGVKEYQIGVEAAKLAMKVLTGTDVADMPVKIMDNLFVFVNSNAVEKQGLHLNDIKAVAKKFRYPVIDLNNKE